MMRWLPFLLLFACNGPVKIGETDTAPPTPPGADLGEPCATTSGCERNTVCSSERVCAPPGDPGTVRFSEHCEASSDCEAGLVCDGTGRCNSINGAGTAGVGEVCVANVDCRFGLGCYANACAGFEPPLNPGAECPVRGGTFRVHFELADAGEDFYRLPYPTDVRRTASGLDLAGHPSFEHPVLGDLAADWLAQVAALPAFGAGQTVFFRLTDLPEFNFAPGPLASGAGVGAVDLTPGPTLGALHPVGFNYRNKQRYICDPWLGASPAVGTPFLSGHTYGVVVSTVIQEDEGGLPAEPSADLEAMLHSDAPTDPASLAAWTALAPFRDGFSAIPSAQVASMATFTVLDIDGAGSAIREAAGGALPPDLELLHVCTNTPGPLGGEPGRGCNGLDPAFTELQGRLTVPVVQQGQAPFALPSQGGEADWTSGRPAILRQERMEFTLTIPTGPVPVEGFPVVLFAHGERGNYRSVIEQGWAGEWSSIPVGADTASFAVLSVDTWLTGPRSGSLDSTWEAAFAAASEPSLLYNNPLNPGAARDNIAQSAIDWYVLVRWLEGIDWSEGANSPTSAPVRFDLNALHFVGEDIGALVGPVYAAYEPRIRSVVLASPSASWMDVVSEATEPFPPALLLKSAFADPDVDHLHPLMSLGQAVVDRVDPINHARSLHTAGSNRDLLVLHGNLDPYVGRTSQKALSVASLADQVIDPGMLPFSNVPEASAPITGNRAGNTAVVRLIDAAEPHFLLEDADVRGEVTVFLGTAAVNGTATVP